MEKTDRLNKAKAQIMLTLIGAFSIMFVLEETVKELLLHYTIWNIGIINSFYRFLQLTPLLVLLVFGTFNYLETGSFVPRPPQKFRFNGDIAAENVGTHQKSDEGALRNLTTNNSPDSVSINTPRDVVRSSTNRIKEEIKNLGLRGNVNLVIGISTTILGAAILIYTAYTTQFSDIFDWKNVAQIILRISIALFLQTFAYFFLKLYKANLEDVKYYQNEITNIEAKFIGLLAAQASNPPVSVKVVVDALIKTERNFILKKGDSTIGLEKERLERNEMIGLVRDALGVVDRRRLFRTTRP